jgi:hypothetical protein
MSGATRRPSLVGSGSLAADQTWAGANLFTKPIAQRAANGQPIIGKALGDGQSGLVYLKHDDTVGYLIHLLSGPNSGVEHVADTGSAPTRVPAATILIGSLKNAGKGLQLYDNPSHIRTGRFYLAAYNKTADPFRVESVRRLAQARCSRRWTTRASSPASRRRSTVTRT